jgi:hypothetical protein
MFPSNSDSNTESDKDDGDSAADNSDPSGESESDASDSDVSDANMYQTEDQQMAWTPCDKKSNDWIKFHRTISDCFNEHINEAVRLKDQPSAIDR